MTVVYSWGFQSIPYGTALLLKAYPEKTKKKHNHPPKLTKGAIVQLAICFHSVGVISELWQQGVECVMIIPLQSPQL